MLLRNGLGAVHCIGTVLLLIGLVLHIVGIGTPSWSVTSATVRGLWKQCNDIECATWTEDSLPHEMRVARAFAIISMLIALITFGFTVTQFIVPDLDAAKKKIFNYIILAETITVLTFIVISTACYGAVHNKLIANYDIGYSLILSVVGGILFFAGGFVFVFASRKEV
uniref:MARVEL domain-containing protein n=1 Tax=Biomphalaria glabrata TaxID=6526 RepID=A0A2C9KQ75_BIOGL